MKINKFFFVPLSFLILASCTNGGNNEENRKPLAKPNIIVNSTKNGLTWAAVENAVSYDITVNEEKPVNVLAPGYDFSTSVGHYSVSVIAVASDTAYNSEAATYNYETKATSLEGVSFKDGVITWTSITGLGVEAKVGAGQYAKVDGNSLEKSFGNC